METGVFIITQLVKWKLLEIDFRALAQYQELQEQTKSMDASALDAARQSIRPDMEREAYRQARESTASGMIPT